MKIQSTATSKIIDTSAANPNAGADAYDSIASLSKGVNELVLKYKDLPDADENDFLGELALYGQQATKLLGKRQSRIA